MGNRYTSSEAIGGGAHGAITGYQVGGPVGAVIGGGIGFFGGADASANREYARKRQEMALAEAKARLEGLQRRAWDLRQQSTAQQLGYFQPAISRASRLTGFQAPVFAPQAAPAPTVPDGMFQPPKPPKSTLNKLVDGFTDFTGDVAKWGAGKLGL